MAKILEVIWGAWEQKYFSEKQKKDSTAGKSIERSLMLVTALSPVIGYDKASKIAHHAMDNHLTLKQAHVVRMSTLPISIPRDGMGYDL
jgi:fumarate hydratase class II